MSRILRRPLFRGGPASSDGVGITSGLNQGYANGGRIGFKEGKGFFDFLSPEVMGEEEAKQLIEEGKLYPYEKRDPSELLKYVPALGRTQGIGSGALKIMGKTPQVLDQYKRYISGIKDPFINGENMVLNSPSAPGMFTNAAIKEAASPYVSGALGVGRSVYDKIKDYGLAIAGAGGLGYGGYKTYKNLTGDNKDKQNNNYNNQDNQNNENTQDKSITKINKIDNSQALKQDIDTYTKLLMENAGSDKDEYTRQKYLTLAKFGLNLLKPTPVGIKPSLATSLASAAEKPLEEYGNISMQQSKEDRALKQAAVQLGIQKHMPGTIAKGIQDLMAMNPNMTAEEATSIVTTGKNTAAIAREKFNEITQKVKDISNMAQSDPALKKLLKLNPNFALDYAKIAVEQGLYSSELKGLADDYNVNALQPGAVYFKKDKQTGELLPHRFIKGKLYSIREPEFKQKGI